MTSYLCLVLVKWSCWYESVKRRGLWNNMVLFVNYLPAVLVVYTHRYTDRKSKWLKRGTWLLLLCMIVKTFPADTDDCKTLWPKQTLNLSDMNSQRHVCFTRNWEVNKHKNICLCLTHTKYCTAILIKTLNWEKSGLNLLSSNFYCWQTVTPTGCSWYCTHTPTGGGSVSVWHLILLK